MNKILSIRTFPRIHVTLIGMNNDGYRINGGIGFSINSPATNFCFTLSNKFMINDNRKSKLTEKELARLQNTLQNVKEYKKITKEFSCTIESEALPHFGFGSSTSIYLSCIEAFFLLNNVPYEREEIVTLSKRGGTSGIGINTYFDGGFIFDVGIKNENDELKPSSVADRKGKKPLVVYKGKLPDWQLGICILNNLRNKSGQEEIDFFDKNCPVEKKYIGDILYESIYGVTSAVIEHDYIAFCNSINAIQQTQWKYLERSLYGEELIILEKKIKLLGADCVGMSSLGPLLFFTGKNINEIIYSIEKDIPEIKCFASALNNEGRSIIYD